MKGVIGFALGFTFGRIGFRWMLHFFYWIVILFLLLK